jgi:hypothetical protein
MEVVNRMKSMASAERLEGALTFFEKSSHQRDRTAVRAYVRVECAVVWRWLAMNVLFVPVR